MRNPSSFLLSLATLSTLLVGCGGSGSHPSTGSTGTGSVAITGGATTAAQTVATAMAAAASPTTASIGGEAVVIPANTAVPAGSVAVVSTPDRLLSLSGTGAFTVGGNATGVSLADGKLGAKIALPPTGDATTTLKATAPTDGFRVASSGGTLTIHNSLELGVPVLSDGTAGIPSAIGGTVPTNGGSGASTNLTATYPVAFATAYSAKLTLIVNGVSIVQTKAIASDGTVAFTASSHLAIPSAGVDGLRLELVHN